MFDLEEMNRWMFVIDTDEYTVDFERQLCAYCTGMVSEVISDICDDEYTEAFFNEENQRDHFVDKDFFCEIGWQRDEGGYPSPVSVCKEVDEEEYQSVAILFFEKPTPKHIEIMKRRALEFSQKKFSFDEFKTNFNIKGFRLLCWKSKFKKEEIDG